jgi:hypothetical protein
MKHPLFLSLFGLLVTASLSAVELTERVSVKRGESGVVVQWNTDVICGTRVSYGITAELLNKKAEGPLGLHHEVTLPDLTPEQVYYVRVGTARVTLQEGRLTIDAGGAPRWQAGFDQAQATSVTPPAKPPKPLPKIQESAEAESAPAVKPKAAATPAKPRAPPTRETWGYLPSLQDHYERHGRDFRCTSADDYAAKAWLFLQYAKQNALPMKWDESDGTLRVWEPSLRVFAAYNRDGTTKTFFRPTSPGYWSRQPGRTVKPSELPF